MPGRPKLFGPIILTCAAVAACANSSTEGAGPPEGFNDLPVQTSIEVPADALRPAGDGKASCDPDTTIAYVGAMTGPTAQLGINIYQAAELAMKEHNDANPGCQVKFIRLDTEGDPNKATGPTAQVVNNENVLAVLGLAYSGESKATGQILEDAGLAHITPSATNPDLVDNGWTTFFRGLGNDAVQGPAAAKLATKLGAETVYVVQDDSEYGIGLAEAITGALGGRLAGTDKITTGQKDFSATVSKIVNADPDAVFYSGFYPEGAPLDQQLVAKGFGGLFLGPDGVKDQNFIDLAGDASRNAYMTCPCLPGELIPEFAKAYKDLTGEEVGTYAVESYDAMTILLAAIDAGSATRAEVLKFLQNYKGQGVGKHYDWDDKGELAVLPVYGFKAQDGRIVSVGKIS